MIDLNRVVLIGRLTRDAELKYTANGQAVCKFSIAVNRRKKNGEQWVDEANFFDVVVWGRQGESLNQYLVKGKQVGIDGELRQDRWEQDGQNRSKVEVVVNNIQLLGGGTPGAGAVSGNSGVSGGGGFSSGGYGASGGGSSYGQQGGGFQERRGEAYQERGVREPPPGAPPNDGFADDIPF
jgi:single-strand DNA-binding protein